MLLLYKIKYNLLIIKGPAHCSVSFGAFCKIEFIQQDLGVSRITASKYLNQLANDGLLRKEKLGTGNFYVNEKLIELLRM